MKRLVTTHRRWLILGGFVAAVILVGAVVVLSRAGDAAGAGEASATTTSQGASPTSSSTSTTTIPEVDLEVVVDPTVEPIVDEIPGIEPDDPPRKVGRSVSADGAISDFVVGEAVIVVPDLASVEALRAHPDVEVVDVDHDPDADPEDGIDVLVRGRDLASLNPAEAAYRFATVDPDLTGTMTVDSPETAATGIILGRLYNDVSTDVGLNYVPIGTDVDEGQLLEALESQLNAFDWPFVKSTAPQGIGLDTAWQMLDHHGKQQNRVSVLVIDRGFVNSPDLPDNARMRKGDWGADPSSVCSGGNACPYHGTQVSLTVAGQHDNLWGTAGVAGPWVQIISMPYKDSSYETMKLAREVIKDEKPDIVNMSFGLRANTNPGATLRQYDKTFRRAERWADTVAFSSAGNEGVDVDTGAPYLPCASTRVVCVGGMGVDTTERASGSNYGTKRDSESVEIYGPMCTYGYADPAANDGRASQVCGTSFASPFVAGVAALLRVADPGISADGIRDILFDTAHVGGLGPLVTGHLRRIDAHMAVAAALGVVWSPPVVEIDTASGVFPVDEIISLSGSAASYVGEPLPLTWWSSIDGQLNATPQTGSIGANLSPGEHLIQATAIDRRGLGSTDAITITIENEPPIVQIISPADGHELYEGTALHLSAYTHDPDIFINEALADDRVRWQIKQGSNVVWESTGHGRLTVLSPGSYEIVLTGTDLHGVSRSDSVEILVKELEPGWQPPSASITMPPADISTGIGGGTTNYELRGLARGVDGNTIAGTRFKWTAEADNGYTIDICVGSSYPGQGSGGGVAILIDCKNTSVDLGIAPGAVGRTIWTIRLNAVDSKGAPVEAIRTIELTFATG
jgi:serine protease